MRTYAQMARAIDEQICLGQPGGYCPWAMRLAPMHERGFIDPFGVVHWNERRWTRRGARNFLLLVAKARREADPDFLNDPRLRWYHLWWDNREADRMAAQCGFRLPARLSRADRAAVVYLAAQQGVHLTPHHPAIYQWSRA